MSETVKVWVKPKPGRVVNMPGTKEELPPTGKLVIFTSYWERRKRDDDIEIVPAPKAPSRQRKEGTA
ncbi:MAG: DUF2635 domain-containing protein [Parvibaculum sp.]|nr:DUF2635 domain-containing protein [Parvibaculum sp.]